MIKQIINLNSLMKVDQLNKNRIHKYIMCIKIKAKNVLIIFIKKFCKILLLNSCYKIIKNNKCKMNFVFKKFNHKYM